MDIAYFILPAYYYKSDDLPSGGDNVSVHTLCHSKNPGVAAEQPLTPF